MFTLWDYTKLPLSSLHGSVELSLGLLIKLTLWDHRATTSILWLTSWVHQALTRLASIHSLHGSTH
ncbi:hypothetical protein Csa_022546 [Cucumis sativus]|uniref:Uncharacterized protein n=1 Tax=Cucumis sativus TaxID=3659 RepID=A0A0A0LQH9_CUCSA|nr:hypothetical protein Csa_022546 [Cucumis sativus]